jgi:ABC-2 type transport system ATP-binding protein
MIELHNVGHSYGTRFGRRTRALDDLTLETSPGEVLGIAGPNGAGKSTLLGILLGYLHPTEGRALIGGLAPRAFIERNGVGYLSELVHIRPRWTVMSALRRYATLAGIPAGGFEYAIDSALTRTGLVEHRTKRIKSLSKGTLQRVGLAQALLRDERLIILDEPTHGLDPVWTSKFRAIVHGLRSPERVIIIASHNLDELQRVTDRVAIISQGRLQRMVSTRAAAAGDATSYAIRLDAAAPEVVADVFPGAMASANGTYHVTVANLPALNRGIAALIERGALVREVIPDRLTLEREFHEAIGETAA